MLGYMAGCAECNEIFPRVGAELAPFGLVVNFEVPHAPAVLAAPVVAFEDLEAEAAVGSRVETKAGALGF